MDFTEIYKPPFKADDLGVYVISSNGVKTFTVAANNPKEEADNVAALLNDEGGTKYKKLMLYGDHKIVTSNAFVLITRGFGHIIGREGMTLEEGYKVQDDFISWAMDKLIDKDE